jgi:peptide/nickel transport system substrate-binding protein
MLKDQERSKRETPSPEVVGLVQYLSSRISRREMLAGLGATALGATSLIALLEACTSSSTSTATPSGAGGAASPYVDNGPSTIYSAVSGSLKKAGTMTYAVPNQVANTMDATKSTAYAVYFATDPIHDWLEHYDQTGVLVPSLAERMDVISNTQIKYTLHDGIKFHNGRAVKAQDVADVIEHLKDPKNGSPIGANLAPITVKVIDDKTLTLNLAPALASVRSLMTRVPIVPLELASQFGSKPVGCGPFRFKEWKQDQYVDVERNPDYWNPQAPRLDSIRALQIPDDVTGTAAYRAGQMDANLLTTFSEYNGLKSQSGNSGVVNQWGWSYIFTNVQKAPYDNPKVRQAIQMCIDRKVASQAEFSGLGFPQYFAGTLPDNPFYPKDLERPKDVQGAKALLSQAGHPSGFSDTLVVLNFPYYQRLAVAVQAMLAQIGINVSLDTIDLATFIDRILVKKNYNIAIIGDGNDPEPGFVLDRYFRSTGGSNWMNYSNPAVDQLLDSAESTFDQAKRTSLYHQVFKTVCIDDVPLTTISSEPFPAVFKTSLNGELWIPTPNERVHYQIAARR